MRCLSDAFPSEVFDEFGPEIRLVKEEQEEEEEVEVVLASLLR